MPRAPGPVFRQDLPRLTSRTTSMAGRRTSLGANLASDYGPTRLTRSAREWFVVPHIGMPANGAHRADVPHFLIAFWPPTSAVVG